MNDQMSGATASRICKQCGAKIIVDSLSGGCPACLLEAGLGLAEGNRGQAIRGSSTPNEQTEPAATAMRDFADYELQQEIGRGGQGVVYRARQKSLNRLVALKVLGLGHFATQAHLQRFRLEAEAAARLEHPSIVPIHEVGECDGSCYFSMNFIEGGPLDQVAGNGPLPTRQAAELMEKVARTLEYAHEHGVLHRDIKPGNILLDAKGEPHVTDFGLARLIETESKVTHTMEVLGTPSYMAPEQAAGKTEELTRATDVYALGAVLYQMLTGHPPFLGETAYETLRLVLETDPRDPRVWNPKVDRDLATICLKCLEKNPLSRYMTALALAQDLERWLKHEPIKARPIGVLSRAQKWVRRKPAFAGLMISLLALAAALGVMTWENKVVHPPPTSGIAVLPFENLSNDREDEFFADGIQDDLITKLAKIGALKVISRTSVMQYPARATGRDIREIGNALRVSHVLTGSVRKTGSWLHINAQLIDARTDTHVWVEQYDRDLTDLFTIQSEIAQGVAEQLQAKISAAERLALQRPPTADLTAFDLYSRAKNLLFDANFSSNAKPNLLQAVDLLNRAVTHDPAFFQAYCQLASSHDLLYLFGLDRTPARLALAEAAIQAALRLRPEAGEAHLARAENRYMGYLDYNGALAELEVAAKTLPNDPRLFELRGYIERRRGNQIEAVRNLERAIDLDPRNVVTLQQIALSYGVLRRYPEKKSALERVLAINPNDAMTKVTRALVELDWKADPEPLHHLIDEIRATNPAEISGIAEVWLICALAMRDAGAAKNALLASGDIPLSDNTVQFSRPFVEGLLARMTQDVQGSRSAFLAARKEQEKTIQAQPNFGPPLCVLGLIDAALGRKEDALREGRRAVEILPVEKDVLNGPRMVAYLAMIAAWVGERDLACNQLAIAIRHPGILSYGQLKLLPSWDPLRGDPRFEKIVASLAPQ